MANLPPHLQEIKKQVEKVAKEYGLDFFETIFEMVSYDQINQIAAFGGFPVRYPHWKFGMEYMQLSKSYEYGLSKIYEMVINNDPCYAYLMEGNSLLDQKLVMAHVYGHCDFFKNNIWFSKTNRKMMDQMANHSTRIERYIDRYGLETVEEFIDTCLSLENLIDRYSPFSPKEYSSRNVEQSLPLLKVEKEYMRKYINPPAFVEEMKRKQEEELSKRVKFPEHAEKDILNFLIYNAPLHDWQVDVLSIIREESYYFAPQGMTKIMNEGWASYWHSKILTQKVLNDSEIIEFAAKHSGVMHMPQNGFNPYKIGIELFRNIEDRWNKGQFGRDWEDCSDVREKNNWDKKLNLGNEKIFEIRKMLNDVSFIDQFLTEDFCVENKFFVYKLNSNTKKYEIDTKDFSMIKKVLLFKLTNFGQPIIELDNANFENKGELLLIHKHEGMDLQPDFMEATVVNLYKIWKRPVNLSTVAEGVSKLFRYDGQWSVK